MVDNGCAAPRTPHLAPESARLSRPPAVLQVRESAACLELDLPSPRRPVMAFVMAVWLVGWALGLVFLAEQFASGALINAARLSLAIWCGVWLAAGALGAIWTLWLVVGRERITLDEHALSIRHSVLGVGFTRAYPLAGITELRTFGREIPPLLAAGLDFSGRGASGVRFHAAHRTVRCARALDELAARSVVATLRARHPFGETVAPGDVSAA